MRLDDIALPRKARAVILDETEGLLLVTEGEGVWQLPGGLLRENESFFWGLSREIREELGCTLASTMVVGHFEAISDGVPTFSRVERALIEGVPSPSGEITDAVFTREPEKYKLCAVTRQVVALLRQNKLI